MINRNTIISELLNRGIDAKAHNVKKNGIVLEGIIFGTASGEGGVHPILYESEIIKEAEDKGWMLDDIVENIIDRIDDMMNVSFDFEKMKDKEYFKAHLFMDLEKEYDNTYVKKPSIFEGISTVLTFRDIVNDFNWSMAIEKDLLKRMEYSEEEMWEIAEKNTFSDCHVERLSDVIARMLDFEEAEFEDIPGFNIYVVSNKKGERGASAILNRKVLEEIGEKLNTKALLIYPSSIHEMLVHRYDGEDLEFHHRMVKEVNETQVEPQEQLADRAFVINL